MKTLKSCDHEFVGLTTPKHHDMVGMYCSECGIEGEFPASWRFNVDTNIYVGKWHIDLITTMDAS